MEGCEADSYRACKPEDYPQLTFKHYCSVRTKVAPENRNKYLTQTELAPGFYIDAYVRLNHFAKEKKQCGSAVGLLRRNLAGALKEAGTYIWFYGEYGCWWKNSLHAKARKTWEEQAPGITEAVKKLMAPEIVFKSTNLLKNPLFKDKSAWTPWQREMDQKKEVPGTITTGNGQTVLKKVTGGCVSQLLPVIPGEYYLFQFRGADLSSGAANATIAFRDQKRKWLDPRYTCSIPVPDTGKFETVTRLIVVPQGASWISIQLGANSLRKQDSGEVIYTGAQLLKY